VVIQINKQFGSFNWANPSEKTWLLSIRVDAGTVSAHFPENDEPDIDGVSPIDVLCMIEERNKNYLCRGAAEKEAPVIQFIKDNQFAVEKEWAETKIKFLQSRSARIFKEIESMRYLLEEPA
jgi:hypothetical protein